MDKGREQELYVTYYQEVYDYIKDKVKTPEQAVEATKETFEEIFMQQDEVGEPEKFLELARKTADLKCKQQKGERIKNGLMITGAAICMIGLVVMLFWMSLLQYTEDGWEIGEAPNDNQELSFCMNEIFKISQSNCAADLMDKTDASAVYQYTGIGDISLIKDGAMAWVVPDEKFYVNGDYILVTYVDPELVESSQRPSSEEMQGWFDKCIK